MAHVAEAVRPTPRPLPDETTAQLDARLQRRRQRLDMWVAERHRVALAHPAVRDRRARPMDDLQGLIHATDAAVAAMLCTSPAGREHDAWLPSAPGMGPVRSATLHAAWPELGRLNQRAIATVVGVAPLNDESGKRSGPRPMRGGRAAVRAGLSMATRTATRFHPVSKAFSQRWLGRGNPRTWPSRRLGASSSRS